MINITNHKPGQLNRGYTLLFAVLVSSLVLSVGISILNISKKEFLLSSSSRESATAFYAADGGLECAVFYDDPSRDHFTVTNYSALPMRCGLFNTSVILSSNGPINTFTFQIKLDAHAETNSCAIVVVTKDTAGAKTSIESSGYNLGWDGNDSTCSQSSPRKVERVLHYDYSAGP